jgi:hypothetical protein
VAEKWIGATTWRTGVRCIRAENSVVVNRVQTWAVNFPAPAWLLRSIETKVSFDSVGSGLTGNLLPVHKDHAISRTFQGDGPHVLRARPTP